MKMRKGTKIYSILRLKCPHCHEGDLFLGKNPYNPRRFDKMPSHCKECGQHFVRETSFYLGAMMVSHTITTVLAVIIHSIVFLFYGLAVIPNITAFLFVLLVIIPPVLRSSRAIWLNVYLKS